VWLCETIGFDEKQRGSARLSEYARYKIYQLTQLLSEQLLLSNKILDFGCGDGEMTGELADCFANSHLFACDTSQKRIDLAKKSFKPIDFFHVKDSLSCFSDNFFDIVVASDVLHHIALENRQKWLREILRVLKPGGKCVVVEQNPYALGSFFWQCKNRGCELLSAQSAKKLFVDFQSVKLRFFLFFQTYCKFLRFLEPLIFLLPFGSVYLICALKK
jgi:ubiquinone/menaquinone biosynthesis C-methylase UbiE